jgi:type VI secretion system protein ImpJ
MSFQTANVNWYDGMLLLPQHFQHSDRSLTATIEDQLKCQPFHWGIQELDIDRNAFSDSQIFSISKAKLRMESGVWIDIPGNAHADFVTFREYSYQNDEAIPVWLGITRQDTEESYKIGSIPLETSEDLNQSFEIPICRRQVTIFFEEPSREYESMKIGEIKRATYSNMPVFNETYIPPLLDINSSRHLNEKLDSLVLALQDQSGILRHKTSKPSFFKQNDVMSIIKGFTKAQVETNSWMQLSQYSKTKSLHPYVLYLELLRLWSNLVLFDDPTELNSVPEYQHGKLSNIFDYLFQSISQKMEGERKSNIERRDFINDGSRWICRIERAWMFEATRFFVCINTERLKNPSDDFFTREGVYIAPNSQIDALFASRKFDKGFNYKKMRTIPTGMPDRSNLQYYELKLDPNHTYWDHMKRELKLALRDIQLSDIPEITLYVEKKKEK